MIRAAIFDLDDTLVDSGVVREARDRGEWAAVARDLSAVSSFAIGGTSVDEVPAILRGRGLKIGVLTHAPRWYAENLLRRFRIPSDVLVTGSDRYPAKPDPTSLKAMIAELGLAPEECVYVGDLHTDAAAAAAAGALSVGARWAATDAYEWRRWWPDVAISDPGLLLQLDEFDRLRPFAEARLRGVEPVWHWGSVMRVGTDVRACGRYFTPEDLDRFPGDPLSSLVLEAKDGAEAATRVTASLPFGLPFDSDPDLLICQEITTATRCRAAAM